MSNDKNTKDERFITPLVSSILPLLMAKEKIQVTNAIKTTSTTTPTTTPTNETNESESEAGTTGKVLDFGDTSLKQEGMDYSWRRIAGIAPGFTTQDLTDLSIYLPAEENEKPRFNPLVYLPGGSGPKGRGYGRQTPLYKGGGLVDENNFLARRQYDVRDANNTDVKNELMLLSRESGQALALFKELKRVGFYGEREISNLALNNQGYGPNDEYAMTQFLEYANQRLQTWQAVLPTLYGLASVAVSGGPTFRGPSTEEVAAFLQEASLSLTGEMLSKSVLKKAILQVTAEAKASYASGTQATPTGLLAESEIKKTNPARRAAYGLGNAIALAFDALGR